MRHRRSLHSGYRIGLINRDFGDRLASYIHFFTSLRLETLNLLYDLVDWDSTLEKWLEQEKHVDIVMFKRKYHPSEDLPTRIVQFWMIGLALSCNPV